MFRSNLRPSVDSRKTAKPQARPPARGELRRIRHGTAAHPATVAPGRPQLIIPRHVPASPSRAPTRLGKPAGAAPSPEFKRFLSLGQCFLSIVVANPDSG